MKFIYLIESEEDKTYKIGNSKNPPNRLKQIQTGNGNTLSIKHLFLSKYPTKLETALHNKFNLEKKRGEWFMLTEEQVNNFIVDCEKIEENITFLKENGNVFI
jgi:predicted GIY-YIG superfamily endonuclease